MRASVVVPTFRRPDALGRCLRALLAQEFDPAGFEILVADDAASEATRRQVEDLAGSSRPSLRHLPVTGARHGPAAARNRGWRAARGEIIAFTDDDCIPDPRWLAEGVGALERREAAAATGRVVVPLPDDPTDYERDAAGLAVAEFVTANCFCRRSVLEAVGGFDERFQAAWREDSDLHFAILERGWPIAQADTAIVVHPVRPAPWGVSLRQQRKSLFNALLFKKHPDLYRRRIRSQPPWDYYATIGSLAVAAGGLLAGSRGLAFAGGVAWVLLTGRLCRRRLRGTSRDPRHVAEMALTSALIPPLSVFWRLYGALKFRVVFF
jgi:glycosyltransferase involved in cell wall biosynthesis